MDNNLVGARIKQLREMRNMNRNELANKAGVSPTYIYQLERGEKSPTVEYLGYICDALGVGLADFFTDDKSDNNDRISALSSEQQKLLNAFLNSLS